MNDCSGLLHCKNVILIVYKRDHGEVISRQCGSSGLNISYQLIFNIFSDMGSK